MIQNKSFTPPKCLLWKDQLDGIIQNKLKPPIMVNIDPTNRCNLDCFWCNGNKINKELQFDKDIMLQLLYDLKEWGVKSICFAGGGEPSLHPDLDTFILQAYIYKLKVGIISNGLSWNDKLINTMAIKANRVGISVDAGTRQTFNKIKGRGDGYRFSTVIKNIQKLSNIKSTNLDLTYKFVIHPINQHEIYDAAKLAKDIGCNLFHMRPVDFLAYQNKEEIFDIKLINNQVLKTLELNDNTFKIIPYFDSFNDDMSVVRHDKCELSPLLGICAADGWWLCIDRKGEKKLKFCDVNKIKEYWGSEEHLNLIDSIKPKVDCGKCTLSKYYSWFEEYKNNNLFWEFV